MTKSEQERLYKHHLNLSVNGRDGKGSDEQFKSKHLRYAKNILESGYPEFEVKEEEIEKPKEEIKPKSKPKEKKK